MRQTSTFRMNGVLILILFSQMAFVNVNLKLVVNEI